MKTSKRIMSLLMALVMIFTMLPLQALATEPEPETSVDTGNMTVEGTNGFGTLLSQEIQGKQEESAKAEEDYEAGYSVMDLTFEGTTATVEYSSLEEAILVVAVYSEDGLKMLASGETLVSPDEDLATVTIEGDMPEYFLASAYLMDTYDLSPLCVAYDTPMYTREMQELLASTVDDYDPEKVLNLDEDETTNFAVYADSTIVIEGGDGVNSVTLVDEENSTYVIADADESVTGLTVGDVFVYPYADGEILIVKVAAIEVDGTTVTITGDELEMEEVFSYVKISDNGETQDFQFDGTGAAEGVTFEGIYSEGDNVPARMTARDSSATFKKYAKFTFDHTLDETQPGAVEGEMKLTGSLNLSMGITVKLYKTSNQHHLEVRLFAEAEIDIAVDTKVSLKLPLFSPKYSNLAVEIGFEPQFIVEVGAKVFVKFTFVAEVVLTFGSKSFDVRTDGGYDDTELGFEGTVFIGIDLNPVVKIAKGYLADLDVEIPVGLEITGTLSGLLSELLDNNAKTRHDCQNCLDIDISFIADYSIKFKLLNKKWPKMESGNKNSIKLASMYLSLDKDAFGVGECPYKQHLVVFEVRNGANLLMPDTEILKKDGTSLGKANHLAILAVWMPTGKTTLKATIFGEEFQKTIKITEDDAGSKIVLKFGVSVSAKDYLTGAEECIDDAVILLNGRCGDNLFWNLDNKGRLMISGTGSMWDYYYEDPPWYNDRSSITSVWLGFKYGDEVTSVGDYAFYDCPNLTSVEIPESVTTIGAGAFSDCTSLRSVEFSDSVTTIGDAAFSYCTSLRSVTIPDSVTTIGAGAFSHCTSLCSATIPDSVTTIASSTFSDCTSLTSVRIPDSVTMIGGTAFSNCDSLHSITIPDNVTTIDYWAFEGCDSLSSVTIGNSVANIGDSAFLMCGNLSEIIFRGNAPSVGDMAFGEVTATIYYPAGNATWTEDAMNDFYGQYSGDFTWIPYTLDENGNMILSEDAAFTVASEPDQMPEETEPVEIVIDNIGEDAPTLDAVYGGDYSSVIIDSYTLKTASFSGLVPGDQYVLLAMVSIDVEDPLAADNLLYIDQAAALEDGTLVFQYVQRVPTDTSYVVACGASNKNLNDAEITFPEMVADGETHIINPTVVYDGETLTEGQDYTIQGTVSFTEPGTYTCYIRGIQKYAGLVECTYTVISPYHEVAYGFCGDNIAWTFYDNGRLTISGNGSMTEFENYPSVPWNSRRSEIVTVIIEEGVTTIGDFAFAECESLTSITIGNSVTTIGYGAFSGCASLTSVKIPDSVTTIGSYVFRDCTSMTSLTIGDSVTAISNGAFQYCENLTSVEIPDSVIRISSQAFHYCLSLASVMIGNSVTDIGTAAFKSCTKLTSVAIPDSVTEIGNEAFYNCTSLSSVEIPDSVTTIGNEAFRSCTGLTNVTIGESLTTIGDNAFSGCSGLTEIHVDENNPNYSSDERGVLFDKEKAELIQAPRAISGSYEIPKSVTAIGHDTFYGCKSLTSVKIPDSVTTIDDNAFGWCTSLSLITFMGDAPAIVEEAFSGVTATAYYPPRNTTWTSDKLQNYGGNITWVIDCPNHNYEAVVTKANCTEPGYTTYTCPKCGDSYVADETKPLGHAYEVAASEDSKLTYTCIACGDTYTEAIPGDLQCTIYEDHVEITGRTDNAGELEIPAEIAGLPVTIIGAYAFSNDTELTSVTIPENVISIGDEAFVNCSNLKTIRFIGNAPAFGDDVFWGVDGSVYYPGDNRTWTSDLMENCNDYSINWVAEGEVFGMEIISIPECGFVGRVPDLSGLCVELIYGNDMHRPVDTSALTISEIDTTTAGKKNVTVSYGVFSEKFTYGVHDREPGVVLDSSLYPESEHKYGNNQDDTQSLTWPGATSIVLVFSEETYVENNYDWILVYDGNGNRMGVYTGYEARGVTLEVPGNTVQVCIVSDSSTNGYGYSFDSITAMGAAIHIGTEHIITVEPTCTEPGRSAFVCSICDQEQYAVIPAISHNYENGHCISCGEDDPNAATVIANGWSGDTTWTLMSDGVLTISGEGKMKNYDYDGGQPWLNKGVDITSVVIEDGVISVGSGAFKDLTTLKSVSLPETLTRMGEAAFYGSGLESVEIPTSLWTIQPYTFKNCVNLTSVSFHEGNLEKISDGAFYGTGLTELVLPDCLDILDTFAFKGCENLTSINIGSGLTELREAVFYGTAISEITIPEGITKIGPYVFKNCVNLESIDLPVSLTSVGEASFYACLELAELNLPDAVTTIGDYAFRKCTSLASVNFGSGLTTIGESSFYGCESIAKLIIPRGVTTIKAYAFKGCTALKNISLSSNLTTLGESAFHSCAGLSGIVIPSKVTIIGEYCFSGSTGIKTIDFLGNAPSIGDGAFNKITATAYYPDGNATWTSAKMQNYGGSITWKAN